MYGSAEYTFSETVVTHTELSKAFGGKHSENIRKLEISNSKMDPGLLLKLPVGSGRAVVDLGNRS